MPNWKLIIKIKNNVFIPKDSLRGTALVDCNRLNNGRRAKKMLLGVCMGKGREIVAASQRRIFLSCQN